MFGIDSCIFEIDRFLLKYWKFSKKYFSSGYSSHDDYSSDDKHTSRARRDKGIYLLAFQLCTCYIVYSFVRFDFSDA